MHVVATTKRTTDAGPPLWEVYTTADAVPRTGSLEWGRRADGARRDPAGQHGPDRTRPASPRTDRAFSDALEIPISPAAEGATLPSGRGLQRTPDSAGRDLSTWRYTVSQGKSGGQPQIEGAYGDRAACSPGAGYDKANTPAACPAKRPNERLEAHCEWMTRSPGRPRVGYSHCADAATGRVLSGRVDEVTRGATIESVEAHYCRARGSALEQGRGIGTLSIQDCGGLRCEWCAEVEQQGASSHTARAFFSDAMRRPLGVTDTGRNTRRHRPKGLGETHVDASILTAGDTIERVRAPNPACPSGPILARARRHSKKIGEKQPRRYSRRRR